MLQYDLISEQWVWGGQELKTSHVIDWELLLGGLSVVATIVH